MKSVDIAFMLLLHHSAMLDDYMSNTIAQFLGRSVMHNLLGDCGRTTQMPGNILLSQSGKRRVTDEGIGRPSRLMQRYLTAERGEPSVSRFLSPVVQSFSPPAIFISSFNHSFGYINTSQNSQHRGSSKMCI